MKCSLGQRITAWLGLTMPSTALKAHPEFYLPLSIYKDSFKCHYCSNISPGKWCLHCDIHPARGTYYDEQGHPCKPTARVRPISKEGYRTPFTILEELCDFEPSHKQSKEEKDMFKKAVYNREELFKVTEALDNLGKFYTIHKRVQSMNVTAADECGIPRKHQAGSDVWYVTEVEALSGAPSAVADLNVNITTDTSSIETAFEELHKLLKRPLSDFVTIEVGEENASQD